LFYLFQIFHYIRYKTIVDANEKSGRGRRKWEFSIQFSIFKFIIYFNRFLKDGCSQTEVLLIVPLKDGKADAILIAILDRLSLYILTVGMLGSPIEMVDINFV
jgi:hypothetical protein